MRKRLRNAAPGSLHTCGALNSWQRKPSHLCMCRSIPFSNCSPPFLLALVGAYCLSRAFWSIYWSSLPWQHCSEGSGHCANCSATFEADPSEQVLCTWSFPMLPSSCKPLLNDPCLLPNTTSTGGPLYTSWFLPSIHSLFMAHPNNPLHKPDA